MHAHHQNSMALFNGNRFPPDNWDRNFQRNPCDMNSAGNGHCMPPLQMPPTPTFRPQQSEGFTQSNVQIRPPISNFPETIHPPGFRFMSPPQNQIFTMNVNTSQNFSRTPDSQNFPPEPTSQNFSRVPNPQNFPVVHDPPNFLRAQDSQNFSKTPDLQNYASTPNLQNFHGETDRQNFAGNISSQDSLRTSNSQDFFTAPYSQNFPAPTNSQNFPSVSHPQNFPTVPNSQNFSRAYDGQSFPRAPNPQNFPRAPNPQNFPRAPNPQNFPRAPNPQNFPRVPNPQSFPRVPNPQNFPRAPDPQIFPAVPNNCRTPDFQNFPKAPGHQNFPRAPGPQNFSGDHSSQDFSRAPNSDNFPGAHGTQNFPTTPNPQNFPGTSGSQNCPGALGSQNFQRTHGFQNFSRSPSPQNFHGAPDVHHSPGSRKFPRSPGSQNFPRSPGSQNFDRAADFQNFSRTPGSFQQSFRPWNRNSSYGGQRPQFQSQTWGPAPFQHFGSHSRQENNRGIQKVKNFKKLKEDSREKTFSCDTCDRAFATENELKDHISQHIKCDQANCTFEAHHKIVALHKKMQHDTGYADRISKLKDDAEIEKWREERKRRFPTAENIKKRKAEQAEREARGEVLETKEFGKFKRKREDNGNAMNKNAHKRRGRRFKKFNDRRRNFTPRLQSFEINVDSESDSDSDSHITLHRFSGMLSLTNSAEKITDEIEEMESTSGPQINQTPIMDEHQLKQNSPKQNLSKPEFDSNFCHPKTPYSDSNSSNLDKDTTAFKSNDDKHNGLINELICESLGDEMEQKSKELFQVEDSDDEGPMAVPIAKCSEKSLALDQDSNQNKDAVNKSICEIPVEKFEEKNVDLVHVADSDDDGPIVTPIRKSSENSPFAKKDLDQNKGNPKVLSESDKQTKTYENGHNRNNNGYNRYSRNRYNQPNGQDCVQIARKSSLLEKLLADDIRHERNVILQCIRHIVKNNFFGIENKCLK